MYTALNKIIYLVSLIVIVQIINQLTIEHDQIFMDIPLGTNLFMVILLMKTLNFPISYWGQKQYMKHMKLINKFIW